MNLFRIKDEIAEKLENSTTEELRKIEESGASKKSSHYRTVEEDTDFCGRLILNITDSCNLACTYCYAKEGTYASDKRWVYMTLDTVRASIRRVLDIFPKGIGMIQFFGGEPLVNREVLRASVLWMEEFFSLKALPMPVLTMVTNGTLIDDEDIDFFNAHFDSLTISLDGEKEINDRQRIYSNRSDSVYDKVVEVIHRMKEKDRKFFLAIEGTINDFHIEAFKRSARNKTYEDLSALPIDQIHISPVIDSEREDAHAIDPYRLFFEDWVEHEFEKNKHNIRLKSIVHIMNAAKDNLVYGNGCGASRTDLAVSVEGDMYPCFMFIGEETFKIGNISDDIENLKENHEKIRRRIADSEENETCQSCWMKPLCAKTYGHCIGARYFTSRNIHQPVERFCRISEGVIETSLACAEKAWSIK